MAKITTGKTRYARKMAKITTGITPYTRKTPDFTTAKRHDAGMNSFPAFNTPPLSLS